MSGAATGWLILATGLLIGSGYAVVGLRWLYRRAPTRRVRHAPPEPVDRIGARLRRLHDLVDATENAANLPAKHLRCQAVRAAYVDALSAACQRFAVPPPSGDPVPQMEIYRVERELRRHGVDVRAGTGEG